MITTTELELKSNLTLGTLETNAKAIKELVETKLEDYSPENYIGRADEAKSDRAVLNKAEKALNDKRLELEREYMQPFQDFKALITDTCKAIKTASGKLDEIVKAEETREKQEKEKLIREYWAQKEITLFELEKIWNPKWLNKTTKQKDIEAEIDAAVQKALNDLAIIDRFPAEDVALIKAEYLNSLDLSAATAKADQLKANRDRLAREKAEREKLQQEASLQQQREEEKADINAEAKRADSSLISAALDVEDTGPARETYALILEGTAQQLIEVRQFMTRTGVTYKKLHQVTDGYRSFWKE